ncbi:MAG TPA: TetR/AcrR family transcriptional regulator [Chloroflexota bacterium]
MKATRRYVMRARAESADGTRQRILDAAGNELWERRVSEVRLEDVAARAEVTVQTVLRVFGSKSDLVELALEPVRDRIMRQRESAEPGDVEGTISALFDHYEQMGDFVIRNLAEEQQLPDLRERLERGRKGHRRSMQRQFAPQLAGRQDKKLVLDCLVVACDVYTWKLLRRDAARSRKEAEACVRHLVSKILEAA